MAILTSLQFYFLPNFQFYTRIFSPFFPLLSSFLYFFLFLSLPFLFTLLYSIYNCTQKMENNFSLPKKHPHSFRKKLKFFSIINFVMFQFFRLNFNFFGQDLHFLSNDAASSSPAILHCWDSWATGGCKTEKNGEVKWGGGKKSKKRRLKNKKRWRKKK